MKFCERCKREIVWGVSESSGERMAFDSWPERRWIFLYANQPTVRWINTWSPHECVAAPRKPPKEAA